MASKEDLSSHAGLETISRELPSRQPKTEDKELQNQRNREQTLHSYQPPISATELGRWQENHNENHSGVSHDRDRTAFRERIENLIETVRNRIEQLSERLRNLAPRERDNQANVQRDQQTKRANQQAISGIEQFNQAVKNHLVTKSKQQTKSPDRGFDYER